MIWLRWSRLIANTSGTHGDWETTEHFRLWQGEFYKGIRDRVPGNVLKWICICWDAIWCILISSILSHRRDTYNDYGRHIWLCGWSKFRVWRFFDFDFGIYSLERRLLVQQVVSWRRQSRTAVMLLTLRRRSIPLTTTWTLLLNSCALVLTYCVLR